MEIPMKLIASSLVFMVLFFSWKLMNWAYFRPKKLEKFLRKHGLKGSRYNFLYGDSKEEMQITLRSFAKPVNFDDDYKPRVAGYLMKSIETYGNCCFYWSGPKPVIILNDPELVKEVLNKQEAFGKPKGHNPLASLFFKGIAYYEGEKWMNHRRILNPAFHLEKLKLMIPAFKLSCEEQLNKWEKLMSSDGSKEIDVWSDMQTITSDAISRTAFGSSYVEGRKIFELQKEQSVNFIQSSRSAYIPGSYYLPTKRNKRMKEIAREVKTLIRDIIDRRIKGMRDGEVSSRDLLGVMLESNFDEIKQRGNKSSGLSMDEIAEECKLFYFAGQETTSVLLSWTMILLSRYPEWQERARDEVLNVFGKKAPDYEGLNQLKIVNMILYEVLRLYPPIAAFIREPRQETKLGNFRLREGMEIKIPITLLHHSTEIWGEDASKFNPERFSEGVANAHKIPGIYFPFGWGPRICIGQVFALLEAKVVISMILQSFSFQLSSSYIHAPFSLITVQPQHGAPLILHKL